MIFYQKLLLCSIILFTVSALNPGIVISIPFPLNLPSPTFALPQSLDDIVINQLDLYNVKMEDLTFEWSLASSEIKITKTGLKMLFDWNYKKDNGYGLFVEDNVELIIKYSLKISQSNRFVLHIDSIQKKGGKASVHLGGNAKQTVIVEVTNIILNYGSVFFWRFVEAYIVDILESVVHPISNDPQLYCFDSAKKDCLYLNTSLIAPPIQTNKSHVLQMNGAAYYSNQQSGILTPSDALIVSNSSKISILIHQNLISRLTQLFLLKKPISFTVNSLGISSLAQIDSRALSSIFINMKTLNTSQNVLISTNFIDVKPFLSSKDGIYAIINGTFRIQTQPIKSDSNQYQKLIKEQQSKNAQLYIDSITGTAKIGLDPVFGYTSISLRINKVQLTDLLIKPQDVTKKLISPNQCYKAFPSLLEFARGAINGDLSNKKVSTSKLGIKSSIQIKIRDRILQLNANLEK